MNTLRATRVAMRLGLPLFVASVALLWWFFGLLRVPDGMDSMLDTHPPGTTCIIWKTPRSVPVGAVVFCDVEGGSWLARVTAVAEDGGLALRCDNRASRFVALERASSYPAAAVRGMVLTQFPP